MACTSCACFCWISLISSTFAACKDCLWDSHSASNSLARFFQVDVSLSAAESFSRSSSLRYFKSSKSLEFSPIFRSDSRAACSLLSNATFVLPWTLRSSSSSSCDSCSFAAKDSAEAARSDMVCTSSACFCWISLISSDFASKYCRLDSHSSSSSVALVFHKTTCPSRPEIFSKSSLLRYCISSIRPCNFSFSSFT